MPGSGLAPGGLPLVLANHWTSGSDGATTAMVFLVAVPYLLIGVVAVLLTRYLRK